MHAPALDILVVADLHAVKAAEHVCAVPGRHTGLGALLLRKAWQRLRHEGVDIGLVVLLGDLVDNGLAPGADKDLAEVAETARGLGVPVLAVPGNHDGDAARFASVFDCQPGLREVAGYGFLLFHDPYDAGDAAAREPAQLEWPHRIAEARPELPLIAVQHNPVHPLIASPYPYLLTNREAVLRAYERTGVILSLSGHYHPGQAAHTVGGVTCVTVPAACEAPFRFAHVQLRGRHVQVREGALSLAAPGLVDVHCHTEYAYCGTTVSAEADIEVSRFMGLAGLCLTEHAFQLYFDKEDAWSYRWQTDAALVENAWRAGRGRMPAYRQAMGAWRSDFVRLGVELDLRADGSLLLADEDRDGWDLWVGSVHNISDGDPRRGTPGELERLFLRDVERLLSHPIHVLAHPFRFFRRAKLDRPTHLYAPVAERLAQAGVAAEVNFHTNVPDVRFVEACLSRGVKIALGTDSHDLAEVGELAPHLDLLRQAGVRDGDLAGLLYRF